MSKSIIVLAVPHQLQGPKFRGHIYDSAYANLIEDFIAGADFVFEEAAGRRPSTAEDIANTVLGPGHYLDIDPPRDERNKYGIAVDTGGACPIDPYQKVEPGVPPDGYNFEIVDEHRKREELWLLRLQDQPFEKGLAICGIAHGLSFAFRLLSAGISVERTNSYIPYHKLCTRSHAS
jgi:hypothetical protein